MITRTKLRQTYVIDILLKIRERVLYLKQHFKDINLLVQKNSPEIDCIRLKIIKALLIYGWDFDEFFMYKFWLLSRKGIHSFVCEFEGCRFRYNLNPEKVHNIFNEKGLTYKMFKPYYHRDVIHFSNNNDESEFLELIKFINSHSEFIVKPNNGSFGNGIKICKFVDSTDNLDFFINELKRNYPKGFVAEELIQQVPEIAAIHHSSVNTVRLTTVLTRNANVYLIKQAFIRFGQGGRCVDNGGNGGIIASIDFETGIVTSAVDEAMNRYVVHPDSQMPLIGFKIPKWEDAKHFAEKLALVFTEAKYVGWDLALTPNGWVVVEGNASGQFIGFQFPNNSGFREEFNYIKRIV